MTVEFSFSFRDIEGDFGEAFNNYFDPIRRAATLAMRDMAELAKTRGRANIAAAGFGTGWQNALRAEVYPERGFSADAAAWIYHRIRYANVFQEGATIRGRPKMWVPLSTTPRLRNKYVKLTPRSFEAEIAKLTPMRMGRKTFLGAPVTVTRAAARKGPPYKITKAGLRRGASDQGITRNVPLFVGVDTVNIRKRFDLRSAIQSAADQLPQLYLRNLEVE